MTILHIKEWSDAHAWASGNSWSLKAYCQRIQMCTNLKGTELKRTARLIKKRELLKLDLSDLKKAEALIHTLESMGASVEIEAQNSNPPFKREALKCNKAITDQISRFVQQYARKASKGKEPNDRQYDRKLEEKIKNLSPELLSELLSGDGESIGPK